MNVYSIPIEAFEMSSPLMVMHCGLYEDSGGAGKYRGGLGWCKSIKVLDNNVSITIRGEGFYIPPWGLYGGKAAKKGKGYIKRSNGELLEIPSKGDYILGKGDEIGYCSAGGGGFGDALGRDPQMVLRDVLDGRVSVSSASEDYGVMLTSDGDKVIDVDKQGCYNMGWWACFGLYVQANNLLNGNAFPEFISAGVSYVDQGSIDYEIEQASARTIKYAG